MNNVIFKKKKLMHACFSTSCLGNICLLLDKSQEEMEGKIEARQENKGNSVALPSHSVALFFTGNNQSQLSAYSQGPAGNKPISGLLK